ncbi:MAG: ABC transporter substrate-binding protein [bacterium]
MLFIISLSVLLYGLSGASQEILVIQSIRIRPYENALTGFREACGCNTRQLVLSETKEADVSGHIRTVKPAAILAIGIDALTAIEGIRDIPVIYLMVLNPWMHHPGGGNITGVSMAIPPEKQLATFREALPDARRIGLLFDPDKSAAFVKRAREAAEESGTTLIAKRVIDARDVPALIKGMKGEIDAFWMLPDTTVISTETIDFLLLFSIENRIPVLTFSEKFVEKGALMSLTFDASDMGRQAGHMAEKILTGTKPNEIPNEEARKVIISINPKTAREMGITFNKTILDRARIVR